MNKAIFIMVIILFGGCSLNKSAELNQEKVNSNITGLYMGEETPSDIGQPYRTYLNFSTDSVWIANFSLECHSVRKLTNESYDNKTRISNITPLSFSIKNVRLTFVNNKEIEKKYKTVYNCIHANPDSLKFEVSNYWYDGILFSQTEEVYYPCD